MPGIQTRRLSKSFGRLRALDSVTIEVEAGEIIALLGPNGAGKSTLLRILGATVLPDAGSAELDGHDVVTDTEEAKRAVGLMLAEERSWYWRLSGRRNLEFFCALHGLRSRQGRERADELLSEFGLRDAADRPCGGYSAGMRARLSLGRALISRPAVLLLDEPTRSLDPVSSVAFRELVLRMAHEEGTAILLATHSLHEAASVATRTIGLAEGRVAFSCEQGASAAALESQMIALV
ncbi:MAG: ABC transporter ATP-binding protein [Solirubrobacterales bacterium]|nr:ABC transporter ATP-binding protein [Solirubrobacterales bacterium]